MPKIISLFIILFFTSIISHAQLSPQRQMSSSPLRIHIGNWRGTLILNDSTELPFSFTTDASPEGFILTIHNGEENISAENLIITKDSINWHMPVFDSWFKCKIDSLGAFHGIFFNNSASRPYQLKFQAEYNLPRFPEYNNRKLTYHFAPRYECTFSPGQIDSSKAVGKFIASENNITGTFLTETGDYRFLEGQYTSGNSFSLSTFDGSHAFLFKAVVDANGILHGDAWYGKFGHGKWIGKRNDNFQLRNPEKLTWITDSSNVNFTFNDLNGKPVSLSDPKFKGKVVIIQIMGSWCPNCMDETAWMTDVYNKYNSQGLEIIALAYERSGDTAKANANIRRVKNHFNSNYTFLNTGKSGRDSASASLPFLNGIMSFPTTIYIDRSGKVRMIYTGYNGPATGNAYEKDSAEHLRLIEQLLAEKGR